MREPIVAAATVAQLYAKTREAETAKKRLREASFPDVRLSERTGSTAAEHLPESEGRTEIDFADSLTAAGFAPAEARTLADAVAAGETLVTVNAGTRVADAVAVLRGENVAAYHLSPAAAAPADASATDVVAGDRVIPLRDEELVPRTVQHDDEARIRKEGVVTEETVVVPVRHERLVAERDGAEPARIPLEETDRR